MGTQKGIPMTNKIKPSELEAGAQHLIQTGQMPSFEELATVIAEMWKKKYAPLILAARKEPNETES